MTLLILGGTADGRRIAEAAFLQNINVIYSVAGLVRTPNLSCEVISGGFTQFGGIENYINQRNISAILDVTHPYAQQMSDKAAKGASVLRIPYWRYHREPWQASGQQQWHEYDNNQQLAAELGQYSSVLLSIGQLEPALIKLIDGLKLNAQSTCSPSINFLSAQQYIVRTAAAAKFNLLDNMQWLKAIGPFTLEDELSLLKKYDIKAIVTKNSGGEATKAKLEAAKMLSIPIYIQSRPELPMADQLFTEHSSCLTFLIAFSKRFSHCFQ